MEQVKKYLDERIDQKFNLIEDKLRNSFQAMKKDNEFIKDKIKELGESVASSNSARVFREFDKFRADVKVDFNEIKGNVEKSISEFKKNDVSPLKEEFGALKKEISKQNVKNEIKGQLRKEIYSEFEKKIDNKFEKFSGVAKETSKDVASYRKDVLNKTNYAIENLNATSNSLKQVVEGEKEAFARVVKARNSSLDKEFSKLKVNISDKLYSAFEERDQKIEKLERQVSYLKGKVKEVNVEVVEKAPEIPHFKQIKDVPQKKSKETVKVVEDKQKPFFIRVLTGKFGKSDKIEEKKSDKKMVKPTKEFKKLGQESDKGFFSSIVDSLSDN
jgi:hypothetical protein